MSFTVEYRHRQDFRPVPGLNCVGPVILVAFRESESGRLVPTEAVIDTGAQVSIFHPRWAGAAGLDLMAGVPQTWRTLGGNSLDGYVHEVTVYIQDEPIDCRIGFATAGIPRNLIGREGFLDRMQIGVRAKSSLLFLELSA